MLFLSFAFFLQSFLQHSWSTLQSKCIHFTELLLPQPYRIKQLFSKAASFPLRRTPIPHQQRSASVSLLSGLTDLLNVFIERYSLNSVDCRQCSPAVVVLFVLWFIGFILHPFVALFISFPFRLSFKQKIRQNLNFKQKLKFNVCIKKFWRQSSLKTHTQRSNTSQNSMNF